jgi:hypothetical protein
MRLKPATSPIREPAVRRTVYVPVYSSIYFGLGRSDTVELAATVSVRNISSAYPLVLNRVLYYDSHGKMVREYIGNPSELPPLAAVEFVVQTRDPAGGPGASFLVEWAGTTDMDEPLIESIMVGQTGSVGISFTSSGRVTKNEGL